MGDQRSVRLQTEEEPIARGDDEQAPVWQPVDADRLKRRKGQPDRDLALALEIDGDDLSRAPVGKPETVVVPTRRLAERDAGHQGLRLGYRGGLLFVVSPTKT